MKRRPEELIGYSHLHVLASMFQVEAIFGGGKDSMYMSIYIEASVPN